MRASSSARSSVRVCAGLGLAALAALPGCEASGPRWSVAPSDVLAPAGTARLLLSADAMLLYAADPLLAGFDGWPLAFRVPAGTTGASCRLELSRGRAPIATLEAPLDASGTRCAVRWDGRASDGAVLAPGPVAVTATLRVGGAVLTTAATEIEVVRLGIDRVELEPSAGDVRAPLLYRRTAGMADGWHELRADAAPFSMGPDAGESGGVALELPGRIARAIPAPHADLLSPPLDARDAGGIEDDTFSLPTAWVAGATPSLVVRVTTDVAGLAPAAGDPRATEVRLVAPEGLSLEGEDRARDGNLVTLAHGASPVPAVGRYDVAYPLRFEARRPGGVWQPVPGAFEVTLRYYGLVALPTFAWSSVPHRAWVDVVDRIAGWVDGASAEADVVAALLVEGIYTDLGLRYDTRSGASFYSDYSDTAFGGAVFDMQGFEERDNGSIINCSDAAAILSSYARMVGLRFRYHILTRFGTTGFDLNYIRAIGMPAFDETPFDSGRGGFRYHAIVGSPDGRTWDATLAVDGDGMPRSTPNTLFLVQGMEPNDYLVALSSEASTIDTDYDEEVRIR